MSSDRHVLLIAVGPVQPFIAAARKIRDLWSGSRMLAKMSKAVARALRDDKCTFVFPSPVQLRSDLERESDFGMANKILALTPAGAAPEKLVASAREAFQAELKHQFDTLESQLTERKANHVVNWDRLRKQSTDYGEFYAVWVPCPQRGYDKARRRAEDLLAARKIARTFLPPAWMPTETIDGKTRGLRKNTLDGARETVLTDVSEQSALVSKPHSRARHTIKVNEHLDALGLAKRWHGLYSDAAEKIQFQTLSDVALVPYREGIARSADFKKLLEEAEVAIASLPVGKGERASLLFKNRLIVALQELKLPNLDEGKDALRALAALYGKTGEPPAYACILHGDGDHMGPTLDHLEQPAHHQAFSSALAGFALDVGKIIKQHRGSLIYSGGDDVLAFLPVHTALPCAIDIRTRFAGAMRAAAQTIAQSMAPAPENPLAVFGRKPPTFSVGLAIVHHLESLHASLETARRAERVAKQDYERDALAIIQAIRGGGELIVGGHWDEKGSTTGPLNGAVGRLQRFVELFKADKISGRLAYQLRGVKKTLGVRNSNFDFANYAAEPELLTMAAAAEARRIVGAKDDDATVKELKDWLERCGDIRAFADELVVAQQIARACDIAEGKFK